MVEIIIGKTVAVLVGIVLVGCLYLIPWAVARDQNHLDQRAILALNFLLGWTILGWVIALVWALKPSRTN